MLRFARDLAALAMLCLLSLAGLAHAAEGGDAAFAAPPDLAARQAPYRRPASIPYPQGNPFTQAGALLGRTLFFDARVSGSGSLACANCHNPSFGWEDGLKLGHGAGLRDLARHSPSILNSAWGGRFFWDGRAPTLETQALGPMGNPREMGADLARLPAKLSAIGGYAPLFARAFPGQGITLATVTKALALFERSIASGATPFDAWLDGEEGVIGAAAKRGFMLFTGQAACSTCHSGWAFTDGRLHDIGLPGADLGRPMVAGRVREGEYGFKTPTLRNVSRRAPYMHDGSLPDLEAVLAHYRSGGLHRPTLSVMMRPITLSDGQAGDIIAFLRSLAEPARSFPAPTLPQ